MFLRSQLRPWPIITALSLLVAVVAVIISIRSAGADDASPGSNDGDSVAARDIAPVIFPGYPVARPAELASASVNGQASAGWYGPNDVMTKGVDSRSAIYPVGCQAVLPLALGPTLDLSSLGLVPGRLSGAFDLLSISIRSNGDCTDGRIVDKGRPVIDTQWRHRESEIWLSISQSVEPARQANFMGRGYATVWANGQLYSISAGSYGPYPIGIREGRGGSGASTPAIAPGEPYPNGNDPRVADVIALAIADLAPSVSKECFAREVVGDWPALADFGFGDPRAALPSGFTQAYIDLRYAQPAPVQCGEPALTFPQSGVQFVVNFTDGRDGNLGINIYPFNPGTEVYPGSLNDYGANWVSKNHQVSIYGNKSNGGLGVDALRKIAKALDPTFNETCLMVERKITEGDLAALGLGKATAPNGYSRDSAEGRSAGVSPSCTDEKLKQYSNVYFHWTFRRDDNVIEANISRSTPNEPSPAQGNIGEGYINWYDGKGTWYSVNGGSRSGKDRPAQDDLIAVAKSMDPSLDISTLTESDGGPIKPLPVDAPAAAPPAQPR